MFPFLQKKLPHCDELFTKFLSPWYPEDHQRKMTRPDMYIISGFEGKPLDILTLQYLPNDLLSQAKQQITQITDAALQDYQLIIRSGKLHMGLLDSVDKHYTRKRISEIIKRSDPTDYSNPYLVSICEFGATLGYLFTDHAEFDWLYSYPYFDSIVVLRETGFGIPVFDWAVKKFSEYGVDDGFAAKCHAALDGIAEHLQKHRKIENS